MSKIYQKIELTANVLIIIVAFLLVGFFVKNYWFSTKNIAEMKTPKIGNKISVPDVNFSSAGKNVFLVLQKGCHFCSESADFYKKLVAEYKDKNINIIAVLPQKKEEAEQYLKELGLQGIEVRESQLDPLEVSGTPTIIVTNNAGEVGNFWVGKLPPEKEKEVLEKLNS